MNSLAQLVDQGGPVMVALIVLSLVLYERCVNLLLLIRDFVPARLSSTGRTSAGRLRQLQDEIGEIFRQQRITIGALIAAAPLLGLLGTVMGMTRIFTSLASQSGDESVRGLARGISMALVTTETGLAIAIPALVILYYAHRQLQRATQRLVALEEEMLEAD
jgi:biopolymer transport protein ExbB/TolQ